MATQDDAVVRGGRMILERETKNTYRFAAAHEDNEPAVATLYINKAAFPNGAPTEIALTIEVVS